jgi:hypothetical protein
VLHQCKIEKDLEEAKLNVQLCHSQPYLIKHALEYTEDFRAKNKPWVAKEIGKTAVKSVDLKDEKGVAEYYNSMINRKNKKDVNVN